jgi:hypothetical protein
MTKRPSGRPKAPHPRDVRVTIRLTEEEADGLYRLMRKGDTLAGLIRRSLVYTLLGSRTSPFDQSRPDTQEAVIQRARRAAHRANATPQPDLEAQIGQALQAAGEDLTDNPTPSAKRPRPRKATPVG